MPFYEFENKETGETTEELMPYRELEDYLKEHPELKQVLTAANFGDSIRMGRQKPSEGFRDHLRRIKKHSGRGNTINTFD